jgi:hypothetical protein
MWIKISSANCFYEQLVSQDLEVEVDILMNVVDLIDFSYCFIDSFGCSFCG